MRQEETNMNLNHYTNEWIEQVTVIIIILCFCLNIEQVHYYYIKNITSYILYVYIQIQSLLYNVNFSNVQ